MSYSFSIRAATKAEAKEKISVQMATVVQQQPIHAVDAEQAKAAASAFIDVVAVDESRDVVVSMNGSVSWSGNPEQPNIGSASVGVSAYLAAKEAPKA
jgi:hypothetical protein